MGEEQKDEEHSVVEIFVEPSELGVYSYSTSDLATLSWLILPLRFDGANHSFYSSSDIGSMRWRFDEQW